MSSVKTYSIEQGVRYLRSRDPVIDRICDSLPPLKRQFRTPSYEGMARIIINQQLSGAAARTIFDRVIDLTDKNILTPKGALEIEDLKFYACGVSKAKTRHIKYLATHLIEHPDFIKSLEILDNLELQTELQKIKGFGPWSASIFSLFYMQRPDVFTHGDASVMRAISNLYGEEVANDKKQLLALITEWSPFNSVVCMLFWHWIDSALKGRNV